MAENALVEADVAAAQRLVAFLDANGFPVKGALWLYETDAERWRFVVSLQEKRADPASFYLDIARLLHAEGNRDDLLDLDQVSFVDSGRSVVSTLAARLRGRRAEGRWLKDEKAGDLCVEDALIVRLPA